MAASRASDLFLEHLQRLERGEQLDFDAFARAHPEEAAELQRLHETWKLTHELLRRLAGRTSGYARYQLKDEIARGGMGAILRIWDEDLRRHLAMKVILGDATPRSQSSKVARFLEEAQVTGQLDHPGIVPVHELGLDPEGRVYFTMKLVKGESLQAVFEHVRNGREGWTPTRALNVLLKVCEAMAYAHDKGVIHRDLKPANVMVGKFGEVHVMDWGLARITDQKDRKDIRIRDDHPRTSEMRGVRADRREEDSDSPLYTMDGDVVGTPAYMPPEQAAGKVDEVGPHSDVYALGAMLYHLIAGHPPYLGPNIRLNNYAVWGLVQHGPPRPIEELAPDVAPELAAICERAMARDWRQRYRDMSELAADLSAYLDHRVVRAYETGTWAETKKWVRRNQKFAVALACAAVILVAGIATSMVLAKRASDKTKDVLKLSAFQTLHDLERRADELWPAEPRRVVEYRAWLADAQDLLAKLTEFRASLAEIEKRALPRSEGDLASQRWQFAEDSKGGETGDCWWHEQLVKLLTDLDAFGDPQTGLIRGDSGAHGWGIQKRMEFASTIEERSLTSVEARRSWSEAIAAIASSGKYSGSNWPSSRGLTPQLGLVPIGADPRSGLWEFAHLQTGAPPESGPDGDVQRDGDGKLVIKEATGIVFVLVPGGTFWMGAQNSDPTGQNYDPSAISDQESPVHEVGLSPYFLSKFEMTQGQWERSTGASPAQLQKAAYQSRWDRAGKGWNALHPVNMVSWTDCMKVLDWFGCELPTDAQWENGCRAGTSTIFWSGNQIERLGEVANIADAYAKAHGADSLTQWESTVDDGNTFDAEIGTYRSNAYGLHDVHGNVWEWVRDGWYGYAAAKQLDPVAPWGNASFHTARGGCFDFGASRARSATKFTTPPERKAGNLGVRPARAITP